MWLFTNFGFFSIVQKQGHTGLTVRTRVQADLDRLRDSFLPTLGPTQAKAGSDYRWRATVPHADFATALGKIAMNLHYGNFKSEVAVRQGKDRAHRYGKVWEALYDLPEETSQQSSATPPPPPRPRPSQKMAYGGVVFDAVGRVLLREPKNHFDGYVWTFAKGRPNPGESAAKAALREVQEETGISAFLLGPIPGNFPGGTTQNCYFMMQADPDAQPGPHDEETASIRWVLPQEARQLIGHSRNSIGRERDLAVLEAALEARNRPTYACLFFPVPDPWWGLRGDPFLWDELRDVLGPRSLPSTYREFANQLEDAFTSLTGFPLSHQGRLFIERLAHGGMSSGQISMSFWQKKAFPLLLERFSRNFPDEE